MTDLMSEFKSESSDLVNQMTALLEQCEEGAAGPDSMEKFGQLADRIMGAARQLERISAGVHSDLTTAAELTQLCKLLGYKSAQLDAKGALWPVAVGVMLDATEELRRLLNGVDMSRPSVASAVENAIIDRLQWLNQQFHKSVDGSVPMSSGRIMDQNYIESLFAKLKNKPS